MLYYFSKVTLYPYRALQCKMIPCVQKFGLSHTPKLLIFNLFAVQT